jgi:hypothetical protein
MSLKASNGALAAAVQGCGLAYPVAWEGKTFTPPANAPWLAVWLLPAFTDAMQTIDKHGGILQVDVSHPLNAGAPAVLADVDKLLRYFAAGKRFITGSQAVTVRKREASRILQIDGWLRVSVSVSYRAGSPI